MLLKPYLCDALLSIAEAGVYHPLWSPMVMAELERNLARRGLEPPYVVRFPATTVSRGPLSPCWPSLAARATPTGKPAGQARREALTRLNGLLDEGRN
ncbi:MAG TPA: hypothetical protein VMV92_17055 [Streptosporangiaceae bacterium]|nr:hypothetical protein [Streptosporangiaceae bacterium]